MTGLVMIIIGLMIMSVGVLLFMIAVTMFDKDDDPLHGMEWEDYVDEEMKEDIKEMMKEFGGDEEE